MDSWDPNGRPTFGQSGTTLIEHDDGLGWAKLGKCGSRVNLNPLRNFLCGNGKQN